MLTLIKAVVALLAALMEHARDRQLIEAGEAKEALRNVRTVERAVTRALEARRRELARPADRLRDDDPYRRD